MSGINLNVLKEKNAQLIFVSQLVSTICEKMMSIGLVWYLTKTYSINIVPFYLAVCFLPHLLMAFYTTAFINRIGPLKTILGAEYFRAIVLITLYFLLPSLDAEARLQALFISGFLVGLGSALFNPAILSLPPSLVDEDKIVGLNALIDTSLSVSTILGASFAIFLLNLIDLNVLVLINGLSFLWAGLLQLGLKQRVGDAPVAEEKIITPVSVLKKYPDIARMLMSFLFLNLVFTPVLVMIPWYVEKVYGGDGSSLATIEGSMGLGAFLVGVFLSLKQMEFDSEKRTSMIAFISALFGLAYLAFSFSTQTWHGASVLFIIGVLSTFLNIQVLTYFQTAVAVHEIPAIMTSVNIISAAAVPLSLGLSGFVLPHVNVMTFAKISGAMILAFAFFLPKFLKGSLLWKSE